MQTWQDEIAKGFVPYHQLTVEDLESTTRPILDLAIE
jgi:hypothetical protein